MTTTIQLPERFNVADYFILPTLTPESAERPYMHCLDDTLTFRGLHEGANQAANALAKLGVEPEHRVMMLMLDGVWFPQVFFGAVRMGAVPVPINTMLSSQEFLYYLNDSRARVLVVDAALWPQIEPIEKELTYQRHIVICNGSVPGKPSLEELLPPESKEFDTVMVTPDDPAFWLYTSGSTGSPKAAVHLHHDMVFSVENLGKQVFQLQHDDLSFSAAKLFFAYGLGNSLFVPLGTASASVVYPGRPTPEAVFETLQRFRPTVFFGVPTLYNGMLATYEKWLAGQEAPNPLPKLEHVNFSVSAGESLPPELYKKWEGFFGSPILDGIGSTEMLHIFMCNRKDDVRPGSTGKLVPGYDARLVDEHNHEVADGEVGALLVRGDSGAAYYWNKHEKTKSTMLGEWLVTGDQFLRDKDGYYWYQGRNDDMMKVSGAWVSPVEVENALLTHPSVGECAVVGHTDPNGLLKPKAFVMLKDDNSRSEALADELRAHVRQAISGFKAPAWVEFVDELPKTATGKIRRFQLRD